MTSLDPPAPATSSGRPSRVAGRARWTRVLAVRVATLAAAAFVLQLSGSAAWDAHLLGVRGESHPATVLEVTRTTWMRPDSAVLAVPGVEPAAAATVSTPRKDLDAGDRVEVVVDPWEPQRAALAGDGWPWRHVLLPLSVLPLLAAYGVRYGRRPPTGPPTTQRGSTRLDSA